MEPEEDQDGAQDPAEEDGSQEHEYVSRPPPQRPGATAEDEGQDGKGRAEVEESGECEWPDILEKDFRRRRRGAEEGGGRKAPEDRSGAAAGHASHEIRPSAQGPLVP